MKIQPVKLFFPFFLILIFINFSGCSERRAEELYETGQFEELQTNYTHARQLYAEVMARYPDSPAAAKSSQRLAEMNKGKDLSNINNNPNYSGDQLMPKGNYGKYEALDHPAILSSLFHPRRDNLSSSPLKNGKEFNIPVEENVVIHGRMHCFKMTAPTILFFHGNGEIVSDYNDIGPIYTKLGINFLVVDYRGYGKSTGDPTVTGMMADAHKIFEFVRNWLKKNDYKGPLFIMGRSLGSASALELAVNYQEQINGLIIESGFAHAIPLLQLLGVDTEALGISEDKGLNNIDKIKSFNKPVLIIHAEFDQIIPFSDGEALFKACPALDKRLLKIPGADHNTIFVRGLRSYMDAVKQFIISD